MADKGRLKVQCFNENSAIPVDNCKVTIEPSKDESVGYSSTSISTNDSGLTEAVELTSAPLENSMNPTDKMPYSLYDITVERSGFESVSIRGIQIYPEETALQQVNLISTNKTKSHRLKRLGFFCFKKMFIFDIDYVKIVIWLERKERR